MKKILLFLIVFLCSIKISAQSNITLIKDINQSYPDNTQPESLVEMDGKLYFLGYNGVSVGQKIYVTDGSEAGTSLVGPSIGTGSGIFNLTVSNGKMFFYYDDGANGLELWSSDGTPGGTNLLKDIRSGSPGSQPENMTACNNLLFFTASDGTASFPELWVTDGTEIGTLKLGSVGASSIGGKFATLNNKIYFSGNTGTGYNLWESDGTIGGTKIISEQINFISTYSAGLLNNVLYFSGSNKANSLESLYSFDGTSFQIINSNVKNTDNFKTYDNKLFFSGVDYASSGEELWVSDGTAIGTYLLKDLATGTDHSRPRGFTVFNNSLYFTTVFTGELWKTDGTAMGTTLVGSGLGQFSRSLYTANGKLYTGNNTMFESDGNTLIEMNPTISLENNYSTKEMIVFNGELYFGAYYRDDQESSKGFELCKINSNSTSTLFDIKSTDHISFYPNPSNGVLNFKGDVSKIYSLKITEIGSGKTVYKSDKITSNALSLESISNGQYLIEINENIFQKLVINKQN